MRYNDKLEKSKEEERREKSRRFPTRLNQTRPYAVLAVTALGGANRWVGLVDNRCVVSNGKLHGMPRRGTT